MPVDFLSSAHGQEPPRRPPPMPQGPQYRPEWVIPPQVTQIPALTQMLMRRPGQPQRQVLANYGR